MRTPVFVQNDDGGLRFQGNHHGTPALVVARMERAHPGARVRADDNGDVVADYRQEVEA